MPLKTLQIAIVGGDPDAVLIGIRSFPIDKLILIAKERDAPTAQQLASGIRSVLKVPVDVEVIPRPDIMAMLDLFSKLLVREKGSYEDVLVNLGGGDKYMTCAATTAAFVNGLKAFEVMDGSVEMLPIMRLSYNEVVSQAKLEILEALQRAGGRVESLNELASISGYGKPLLSYHLHGSEDSKGLLELGLVEVERGARGRTKIALTALGKVLLQQRPR